jgi:hypothetical protein
VSHTPPINCCEKVLVPINAGGAFLVPGWVLVRGWLHFLLVRLSAHWFEGLATRYPSECAGLEKNRARTRGPGSRRLRLKYLEKSLWMRRLAFDLSPQGLLTSKCKGMIIRQKSCTSMRPARTGIGSSEHRCESRRAFALRLPDLSKDVKCLGNLVGVCVPCPQDWTRATGLQAAGTFPSRNRGGVCDSVCPSQACCNM